MKAQVQAFPDTVPEFRYPLPARLIHGAVALFFIGSWATGELAEHGGLANPGYLLHAGLGLLAGLALAARMVYGVVGPREMRFTAWAPVTRRRLALVAEDLRGLLCLRLPHHTGRGGLAGLVQSLGLLLLLWMAASGVLLLIGETGVLSHAAMEAIEEVHEVGEGLVPAYLLLHVGAVMLHALAGRAIWQRMV